MTEARDKKKVVIGVTGSIAAYKSAELARLLISRGYAVRTILSPSAQKFITPMTFQAITGEAVVTDFWDTSDVSDIEHVELADWADVVVIAPATANAIAKIAHGVADSPLYATILATKAPVLVAPAMNVNMLEKAVTQDNIELLRKRGFYFTDPEEGELACGWHGAGRLAEPTHIFLDIERALSAGDYRGKRVLVTTGPTRESLDPVRFISNRSSGKMGVALAREAYRRGAEVTVIHGPMRAEVPCVGTRIPVTTAEEMYQAAIARAFESINPPDIVIMASAVADYRSDSVADEKIKKHSETLNIKLVKNRDILSELGKSRGENNRPMLVGFAVETGQELQELIDQARSKLETKNADMIVGNFAEEAFDLDTNRVWIIDKTGRQEEVATTYKTRVANKILDAILRIY